MVKQIKLLNTSDTATVSDAITVTSTTSVKISDAEEHRVGIGIYVKDAPVWIKMQPASTDNDKKGFYLPAGQMLEMNCLSMYTGEISAIAEGADAEIYVTEI